jgi:hypothetical protein
MPMRRAAHLEAELGVAAADVEETLGLDRVQGNLGPRLEGLVEVVEVDHYVLGQARGHAWGRRGRWCLVGGERDASNIWLLGRCPRGICSSHAHRRVEAAVLRDTSVGRSTLAATGRAGAVVRGRGVAHAAAQREAFQAARELRLPSPPAMPRSLGRRR